MNIKIICAVVVVGSIGILGLTSKAEAACQWGPMSAWTYGSTAVYCSVQTQGPMKITFKAVESLANCNSDGAICIVANNWRTNQSILDDGTGIAIQNAARIVNPQNGNTYMRYQYKYSAGYHYSGDDENNEYANGTTEIFTAAYCAIAYNCYGP